MQYASYKCIDYGETMISKEIKEEFLKLCHAWALYLMGRGALIVLSNKKIQK